MKKKSAYWYNEEDKSGNTIAKLYLANCYRLGKELIKMKSKHLNIIKY
jgi:hypothetical protein